MVLCEGEGNSQAGVLTELLEGRCEAAWGYVGVRAERGKCFVIPLEAWRQGAVFQKWGLAVGM